MQTEGQDSKSKPVRPAGIGMGLDVKVGVQMLWGLQQQAETLVNLERVEAREV